MDRGSTSARVSLFAVALLLGGCRDERLAREKLGADGFSDIELTPASGQSFTFTAKKGTQTCKGSVTAALGKYSYSSSCAEPKRECGPSAPDVCLNEGVEAEKTDPEKAVQLFQKGCDADNAGSCVNLGVFQEQGKGTPKDVKKAIDSYKKACNLKSGLGCRNLGVVYENPADGEVDKDAARHSYEAACQYGDTPGCGNLGVLYMNGDGIPADKQKAREYLQKACDAKDELHCMNLGILLIRGEGGPEDKPKGTEYLRTACDHDQGRACGNLGAFMRTKNIEDKNTEMGALDEKGCKLKDRVACFELGLAFDRGQGGMPKDDKRALEAFAQGCDLNDSTSCYNVGLFRKLGRGGPVDLRASAEAYDKACKAGDADACKALKELPPH
jgi:TPR repeat protein